MEAKNGMKEGGVEPMEGEGMFCLPAEREGCVDPTEGQLDRDEDLDRPSGG